MVTPHDGRPHIRLSGVRTCNHPYGSPAPYHYAMGAIQTLYYQAIHRPYLSSQDDVILRRMYSHSSVNLYNLRSPYRDKSHTTICQ